MDEEEIKQAVQELYGKIARGEVSSCCPTCGLTPAEQCLAVGYTVEDLTSVPELAILGVGCGNPAALADLKAGETVLDLGAGAGIDVFLASKKVGEQGRVIGIDLTEEMVARGRLLADRHGYGNVEFRRGEIEHLPVTSDSVDVILSNCVINLTRDKLATFKEAQRVLKPCGRLLISDLVTAGPLPPEVRQSAAAWAACLAGALEKEEYLKIIGQAGFEEITVVSESTYGAPELDAQLRGKIISITVRAFKKK